MDRWGFIIDLTYHPEEIENEMIDLRFDIKTLGIQEWRSTMDARRRREESEVGEISDDSQSECKKLDSD